MKSVRLKRITGTICFILLFCFVFHCVAHFMERKDSMEQFSEFWSDPAGYDVWFLGNSHMYRGVLPMELWKENEIRSYVLASSGCRPSQMYWTLVNALDYAKPSVLVVDCYHIQHDLKIQEAGDGRQQMHNGFDAIPLSANKIRAVMDLFDTTEERLEYLFPFSVYHNRWEEIERGDFSPNYTVQKGCKISTVVKDLSGYKLIDESDMIAEETIGYLYMRKIIELCQANDIAVILEALPCCKGKEIQRALNGVARLSTEYGVPFLNMPYDDTLRIDYQTDFKDVGHLNLSGQRKTSKYIGQYLNDHFQFSKNSLPEREIAKWDNDYLAYTEKKAAWLRGQTRLSAYLMWLGDEGFTCEIYQKEGTSPTPAVSKLLDAVSEKQFIGKEEAAAQIGGNFDGDYAFIVRHAATGELVDTAIFELEKRK